MLLAGKLPPVVRRRGARLAGPAAGSTVLRARARRGDPDPARNGGYVETIIDRSVLEEFRAGLRGTAYAPDEEGYDEGRQAFNLNAHQHPALVVMAAGAADVMAAVRLARDEGLGVGVLATGHAVAAPCDGGVLINTSRMRGVRVDPEAQTARVEAGALWADVVAEAQVFGLARACWAPRPA